jgi:hypothetical protein
MHVLNTPQSHGAQPKCAQYTNRGSNWWNVNIYVVLLHSFKSKMQDRYTNLACGVIWVPQLLKCTSTSLHLLISSCEVRNVITWVNLLTWQVDCVLTWTVHVGPTCQASLLFCIVSISCRREALQLAEPPPYAPPTKVSSPPLPRKAAAVAVCSTVSGCCCSLLYCTRLSTTAVVRPRRAVNSSAHNQGWQ